MIFLWFSQLRWILPHVSAQKITWPRFPPLAPGRVAPLTRLGGITGAQGTQVGHLRLTDRSSEEDHLWFTKHVMLVQQCHLHHPPGKSPFLWVGFQPSNINVVYDIATYPHEHIQKTCWIHLLWSFNNTFEQLKGTMRKSPFKHQNAKFLWLSA